VEVSAPVVVPSPLRHTYPRKAKSLGDAKRPITTPIHGHHVEVSANVVVPSPSRPISPQKTKSLGEALFPANDSWSCKITFPLLMVWKL